MKAKKTEEPVVLPRVPSQLIRLALKDLAKCEKSPLYEVDMSGWHIPIPPNGTRAMCSVCLAGAVMAQSLQVPLLANEQPWTPKHLDNFNQLMALDSLRKGRVSTALRILGLPDAGDHDRPVHYYGMDPKRFRRDMLKLARDLEKAGM